MYSNSQTIIIEMEILLIRQDWGTIEGSGHLSQEIKQKTDINKGEKWEDEVNNINKNSPILGLEVTYAVNFLNHPHQKQTKQSLHYHHT